MKFLTLLICLIATTACAQLKTFQLNELSGSDFKQFIANKKVIVVGEMHGTNEVPRFVLQLIKQLKQANKKLIVGLEINSNYQKDLDEFLKSGDFEKLIKIDYFKTHDGRTSEAVGELIKGIRKLKNVKVICFDVVSGQQIEMNKRDSLMAINLNNGYKEGQLIVLTGNLHANLQAGYWRPDFKSAIYNFNKLRAFGDKLISLNTYYAGGTIWNCMQDGCRERDAGINGDNFKRRLGLEEFVAFYDNVDPSGYSGFVYFDKVTSSKPIVE